MFRLHKTRPTAKSRERIDFKFSNFKALQVPKGWDKLFVSVISNETGKTVAKLSKALVRNGNCHWTDTVSESLWVAQDHDEGLLSFKLVVAMGSGRSGILGETTVNMTSYLSSTAVVLVSFPLKKCNYGTILQVKIHCLTARRKLREDESKDLNAESHDVDNKSDGYDSIVPQGTDSCCSEQLDSGSRKEQETRGKSSSASGSYHSYESVECSTESKSLFLSNNLGGDDGHLIRRPDSTSDQNNLPEDSKHVDEHSESNHSSFDSEAAGSCDHSGSNQKGPFHGSLLEAAEDTIEQLHAESKMWQRKAQKLMLDLDILMKESSDQSKKQANLEMELSAARTECNGFRKEVEQLKLLLATSITLEDSALRDEGVTHIQKELKDEINFQRELNSNLALQLKRSQESNIELVNVLQELEETIENQKLEIQNLSSLQSEFVRMENTIQVNIEEKENYLMQRQQLQESEKNLLAKVQLLEQALEEQSNSTENDASVNNQIFLEVEKEYEAKLPAKDDEIAGLKARLSESQKKTYSAEVEPISGGDVDLRQEIEELKAKMQDLERDCNELTDENLNLLCKLKEIEKCSSGERESLLLSSSELSENSSNSRSEVSEPEIKGHNLEEMLKKNLLGEIKSQYDVSMLELEVLRNELEAEVRLLTQELRCKRSEIERLEATMKSREEEINDLRYCQSELEAKVANIQREKFQMEEDMEIVSRERDIATKGLNDLQNSIVELNGSIDSYVSAKRTLESKFSELDREKGELEHENARLSACISDLEAQLRFLTDERESRHLQLENTNSLAMNLQDEVTRLRNEIETQEIDLKQKLEDMHNRWSDSQQESEHLRRENSKFQATTNSLIEEYNSFQMSNEDLRMQNFELEKHCINMEAELRVANDSLSNYSRKVEDLEANLSSVLEDVASKEKSLTSQLNALLDENGKQNERLKLAESSLNQMYLERAIEVENLQQEIGNLTKQLSATHHERQRIASEAELEVSSLHADKAKLQGTLQELQSKLKWAENELNSIQINFETKVQGLMGELAASKQNQEMLLANHQKVLKLLEKYKVSEEKFKINLNDIELKLTVSEYERQLLTEESTNMKAQLMRIEHLEDEVFSLKNELSKTKSEKENLKTSLHLTSSECEELKAEKVSFLGKISDLRVAVSELEDCKSKRVILEEKLVQMEHDLMEKELLCAQLDELQNELFLIKRSNRQLQWKAQLLEEKKYECLVKTQALGEELDLVKEEGPHQRESSSISSYSCEHQREIDNGYETHKENSPVARVEAFSNIQLQEAKTMDANSMYKAQLSRWHSEGKRNHSNARKVTGQGEVVTRARFERTKSSLEGELREIRERYLQMSLKYAEVEAQREELVMKLKNATNGKRQFS